MKIQFSKIVFAAAFGLALALTFGCSDNKDDDNPPPTPAISSSSGGDNPVSSSSGNTVGTSSSGGSGNLSSSSVGGSYTEKGNNIANYKTKQIGTQVWMAENLNYNVSGSKCYGEGGQVYDKENDDLITLSYAEVQDNCAKYGRLYNWAAAMDLPSKCNSTLSTNDAACAIRTPSHRGICPVGWHIPANADWDELYRYVDGTNGTSSPYESPTAGKYLKATSGWNNDYYGNSGNGEDSRGFSALPGGAGSSDGFFGNVGDDGFWWSSNESDWTNDGKWSSSEVAYTQRMDNGGDKTFYSSMIKSNLFSVRCVMD